MKTFEEICPLWAEKIKEKGLEGARERCVKNNTTLDIGNYANCIVGEAYRFRIRQIERSTGTETVATYTGLGEDTCPKCIDFANILEQKLRRDKELEFELAKQSFVAHWNQYHEYHGR